MLTPDEPRWRIEDFARQVGLSVDTVRFYQKRGLVPSPVREGRIAWYGAEHEGRVSQVRGLQQEGFTLAMIRRVLDGDLAAVDRPLAVAVAETDAEAFLSIEELAELAAVPVALIEAGITEGLLVPRLHDGEAHFTTADVEVVAAGLQLLQAGLPLSALLELARAHHEATMAVAESAVALFDEYVRQPLLAADLDDDERAARLVSAFRQLLPAASTMVAQHFRRVLLRVAQEHLETVGDAHEIEAAAAATLRIEDWLG